MGRPHAATHAHRRGHRCPQASRVWEPGVNAPPFSETCFLGAPVTHTRQGPTAQKGQWSPPVVAGGEIQLETKSSPSQKSPAQRKAVEKDSTSVPE